ncbi:MAG: SDR family oxidoreductase [Deltaproteobacteria bacterium]|nr:SDR family oxidoreductase [Deltaproteobacteria bacterium]
MNLKNQVVLITGGGSGIGRLMAKNFGREGSRVVLWDINEAGLKRTAEEIKAEGGEAHSYICDVSNNEAVYEVAAKVAKEVGGVDILVNNAGIVTGKPFLKCTDEEVRRTMEVNALAHFWTIRAFLPGMIKRNHGRIVTIASSAGWVGVASLADYCASKFANVGFQEAIRQELRKDGVKGVSTTLVCPFFIDTGMFKGVKTRFNFLLPILNEDKVAANVVKAVKNDRMLLKMPPFIYTVPFFRLVPPAVMDVVAEFLGVSSSMDEFVGRAKNAAIAKLPKGKKATGSAA